MSKTANKPRRGQNKLEKKNLTRFEVAEIGTGKEIELVDFLSIGKPSSQKSNNLIKIPALKVPSQQILSERNFLLTSIENPYEPTVVKKLKTDYASVDTNSDNLFPKSMTCFSGIAESYVKPINFFENLQSTNKLDSKDDVEDQDHKLNFTMNQVNDSFDVSLKLFESNDPSNNRVIELNQFSQLVLTHMENSIQQQIARSQNLLRNSVIDQQYNLNLLKLAKLIIIKQEQEQQVKANLFKKLLICDIVKNMQVNSWSSD